MMILSKPQKFPSQAFKLSSFFLIDFIEVKGYAYCAAFVPAYCRFLPSSYRPNIGVAIISAFQPRQRNVQESSMNIFVGNLAFEASPEELKKAFEQFGEVTMLRIMMNDKGTKSRGFAFLEMPDEAQARKAIAALNGKEFIGRQIVVAVARPKPGEAQEKPKVKRHRGNFRAEGNRRERKREQYSGYGEGGGYRGGKRMRGRISGIPRERQESAGPHRRPAKPWEKTSSAGKKPWRGKDESFVKPQRAWQKRDEGRPVPFRSSENAGDERKERGRFVKPWERTAPAPSGAGHRESRGSFDSRSRGDRREKPWRKPVGGRPQRPWDGKEKNYGGPRRPWKKRDESPSVPFRRSEHSGAERKERGRTAPASSGAGHRESRGSFDSRGRGDRRERPWSKPAGGRPQRPWSGKERNYGGPRRPWKRSNEDQGPFRREEHPAAGHRERGSFVKPWEREKRPVSGKRPFRPARRETDVPVRDDKRGKSWSKPAGPRRSSERAKTVKPGVPRQRSFSRERHAAKP